jgi:Protein of unknown function (DUF3349)
MQTTLPLHLRSTYKLIQSAFPNGIESWAYLPLLALLYKDMSDRNLAEVIAHCTDKDYELVLNDIYRAVSTSKPEPEAITEVKQYLQKFGYTEWLEES